MTIYSLALLALFISAIYAAYCIVAETATIVTLIFPGIPIWAAVTAGIAIIIAVECAIFAILTKEE